MGRRWGLIFGGLYGPGFFHRHDAYVAALGEALKGEYTEIARQGMLLQAWLCPSTTRKAEKETTTADDRGRVLSFENTVKALSRAPRLESSVGSDQPCLALALTVDI